MVIAITSLFVTLMMSLLVTRVGASALALTGVSPEMAWFQARSAFSGVGYTTSEAEAIVNHPVRRRIVAVLMLMGNLQIAATMASATVTVLQLNASEHVSLVVGGLIGGLLLMWYLASSRTVAQLLNSMITWALRHWTNLKVQDYVAVLQLEQGFAVSEMAVHTDDWMADRTLRELRLPDEGVMVLGIDRKAIGYIGAPTADTKILTGDKLIVYGQTKRMEDLDARRKDEHGLKAHEEAVEQHTEFVEELRQSMTLSGFLPVQVGEEFGEK